MKKRRASPRGSGTKKGRINPALRVTVDVASRDDLARLGEMAGTPEFVSKREVFLEGLRILAGIHKTTQRRGVALQLVDAEGKIVESFDDWYSVAAVKPPKGVRLVDLQKVSSDTIRLLSATARDLRDSSLEAIAAECACARWHPRTTTIDAATLVELAVSAYTAGDAQWMGAVRDVFTQIYTEFQSFRSLVSHAIHGHRPMFDTRYAEQRFISDQYQAAVRAAYGAG